MKRYNVLNNAIGWLCFLIAAATYLLTIEPTASFWDCPEFITQGYKLEIGHPPGNPIFMLTARFFVNFAGGEVTKVAMMVNAMSALLSAGTILLLFWTITHLVKKLVVRDDAAEVSLVKMIAIFGSGICGALMYTWSDTFWFSAVEGEVYAFSSFCTALVFWLILKWENRADNPMSDKYLIFIAYIIGISIAVHLLNLLCIPAIVLVIYYRKWKKTTALGSILALCVSFVIIALILYGLVPGFISVAQRFELFCVNTLGMSYNMGVLLYAIIAVACFVWTIFNIYRKNNQALIRVSVFLSVILSGMPFIGHGWIVPTLLIIALGTYLFVVKILPLRVLNIAVTSIMVIFAGYSSYALLLIRSSAHTPMNQNAPDNVFALASYLNREQYGERPLIYGETIYSGNAVVQVQHDDGSVDYKTESGEQNYARTLKESNTDPDRYESTGETKKYVTAPELDALFPRMYSSSPQHISSYNSWIGGLEGREVDATILEDEEGNQLETQSFVKPTLGDNLKFFFIYQLNHMYWRYFLWNFAGRQNDIAGNGEPTHGNWLSGIPALDNARLGDQSLLPDELGKDNPGHNVFFMLPLIMGLIGLIWQASTSKRGIEQFWVVFFLFFMTGIAIVLYLNQTPGQPRERDYAFAGSFYAYAIWVGMGVAGLWRLLVKTTRDMSAKHKSTDENQANYDFDKQSKQYRTSLITAIVAAVVGLIVPLQVVSQTWDDHDRSGRTAARDFGMNYLNSLDDNAIIFTYGDNDTFPLWYAQEVEGVRTDVKVVNLSYLTTPWYINQLRLPTYDAPGIDFIASRQVVGYGEDIDQVYYMGYGEQLTPAIQSLKEAYKFTETGDGRKFHIMQHPLIYFQGDTARAKQLGMVNDYDYLTDSITIQMGRGSNHAYINHIMLADMLAQSSANGWNRPIYFATTVPSNHYIGLTPYFKQTGMAYQVTPALNISESRIAVNTDKMYDNIMNKWKWGGFDQAAKGKKIYFDETVRRMGLSNRQAMIELVRGLADEASYIQYVETDSVKAERLSAERIAKANNVLAKMQKVIPESVLPYELIEIDNLVDAYDALYQATGDKKYIQLNAAMLRKQILRYAQFIRYYQSLSPFFYDQLAQSADKNIEIYFPELIEWYSERTDADKVEQLITTLQNDYKIDLKRAFKVRMDAYGDEYADE